MGEKRYREIATSRETGETLWNEEYQFSHLSAKGEFIVHDSIGYIIVESKIINDAYIHTILTRKRI